MGGSVGSGSALTGDSAGDGGGEGRSAAARVLPRGLYGQIDEESDDDDGGRR